MQIRYDYGTVGNLGKLRCQTVLLVKIPKNSGQMQKIHKKIDSAFSTLLNCFLKAISLNGKTNSGEIWGKPGQTFLKFRKNVFRNKIGNKF